MSDKTTPEPLINRVFIKMLPIVFALSFYTYAAVLMRGIRTLASPDQIILLGFLPYAFFAYRRARNDYHAAKYPLNKRDVLSWCTRYNGWVTAGILIMFFLSAIERTFRVDFWNVVFAVFFIRYLEHLIRRGNHDYRTWIMLPRFKKTDFILAVAFYYNVIYLYVLLQQKHESLRDPVFITVFMSFLIVNIASRRSAFSDSKKHAASTGAGVRWFAVASLVVKYAVLTIFLIYANTRYLYVNQILAVVLFFLPIYYIESRFARFVKDFRGRNYTGVSYISAFRNPGEILLFVFFSICCFSSMNPSLRPEWFHSHVYYAFSELGLFVFARMEITLLLFAAFSIAYYVIWMKRFRGRLFFSVAAPLIFMLLCYANFYWNVAGGQSEKSVRDGGAVRVLTYPSPPSELSFRRRLNYSTRFPLALRLAPESDALYVSFGSIYGNSREGPSIIVSSLDGSNVTRILPLQGRKPVVRDFQIETKGDDLFLNNQGNVFLFGGLGFDVDDDPPTGTIGISPYELTTYDLIFHKTAYDKERNVTYVVVTGDQGSLLLEVDPDTLLVLRKKNIEQMVISVKYDNARDEILMGCLLNKFIIGVDRESFEVAALYEIPTSMIRDFIVDSERDRVYLVDYLGGTVIEMDRGFEKVIKTTNVGNKPRGISKLGESLYVASTLGVFRLDTGKDAISGNKSRR